LIWYYDTLDLAPYLRLGINVLNVDVIRYFAASRGGMPFERTAKPGLTLVGRVEAAGGEAIMIDSGQTENWLAQVDDSVQFPMGLVDDGFLHVRARDSHC
jgi:hypothetical protein